MSKILYGLNDDEILSWSDPEDRARDFIDSNWTENSPADLPEYIEVYRYRPITVPEYHYSFDRAFDDIYECIDEDFGDPEGDGSLEFADEDEVTAAFDAFKSVFIKNYKVWAHEKFGDPIRVYLAPLIDDEGQEIEQSMLDNFARKISGKEYPARELIEHRDEAKALGLIYVYGMSDDLLEINGVINEEHDALNGYKNKAIEAVWCPENHDGVSWEIVTDLPHSKFTIVEDGEVYCIGAVIKYSDYSSVLSG